MMELKKTASVTSFVENSPVGMTMFGLDENVKEEDIQFGLDVGMTIAPLVFQCACRHLDEFEDEQVREIIRSIADECFS